MKKKVIYECHSLSIALWLILKKKGVRLEMGNFHCAGHYEENGERKFGRISCEHSWLVTPDGTIIDPYPVAALSMNPVMYVTKGTYARITNWLFVPDEKIRKKFYTKKLKTARILKNMYHEAGLAQRVGASGVKSQ